MPEGRGHSPLPLLCCSMSDTLPREGGSEAPPLVWDPYPSPPSSGRGRVSLPSGDKRNLTRYTAEHYEDDEASEHHTKRARPHAAARSAVLSPPSTRGRRMGDRLGLHGPGGAAGRGYPPSTSRHARSGSDSVFGTWLESESDPDTPGPYRRAQRFHAPHFDSYPVRDAAHNPFLEGGPADVGFTGPHAHRARVRAALAPPKESGKALFVLYV